MVIRRGRSEAADKIFTYVAIAVIGVVVIGGFWFFWKQLAPTVGLMTEETLLDTEVKIAPGEAKRFANLEVKPMGRSHSKYRLELLPSQGEAFGGVVIQGKRLEGGNTIWGGATAGILQTVQGRERHISWNIEPGKYDVVVENRAQMTLVTRVTLKIIYDK